MQLKGYYALFLDYLGSSRYPRDMLRGIPEELQCTIDRLCDMHPAEEARHRLESLTKWMSRAKELEPVEAKLKELMPSHCKQILINKRLQLFKEMLEASEHKDLSLVSDMSEGFKLSGPIRMCDAFRAKRTSATLTTAALRKSAMAARKGIIHSNKGSGILNRGDSIRAGKGPAPRQRLAGRGGGHSPGIHGERTRQRSSPRL